MSGFSVEWERCYSDGSQLSVWPWSDVVSLLHRHCSQIIAGEGRVLELGCGAGANIPLFRSLGLKYFGIEGSRTIVKMLHQRYPDMFTQIFCGDFTVEQPFQTKFDLVIDRAAITHNDTISIKKTLSSVLASLKPNGFFIGVDWFSTNHSDAFLGGVKEDSHTQTNYVSGQFAEVGKVHFSDETHLRELFDDFDIIYMEEKIIRCFEPANGHQFASWNIVARKPSD